MDRHNFKTRAYVLQNEHEFMLEYFLVYSANGEAKYGVTVRLFKNNVLIDWASATPFKSEDTAIDYIDFFARNFLFPCSLADVVEDMADCEQPC